MSKAPEPQSLETYLAQIEHELRALPAQARADEMREIEAHLRTLIEARGDNSTAEALAQFGSPRRVGRDLRWAWERKQPEAWWRAGVAMMFAIGFFSVIALPMLQGFYAFGQIARLNPTAGFESFLVDVQFLAFPLTFLASYIIGLLSPKRSYLGVAALLLTMLFYNPIDQAGAMSVWVLVLFANLIVSAAIGTTFGARHGRKLLARIAAGGTSNVEKI